MREIVQMIAKFLLLVTSWPYIWSFPKIGVVLPVDPYIYIENNVTLYCTLTKYDAIFDSRHLRFYRHSNEVIPTEYISRESTRTIILRYPIKSPKDAGRYTCKLNQTNNKTLEIGSQYVDVEYEPKPVTEISCRVYNWQSMICTWDLGVKFLNTKTLNVSLVWAISDYQYDCPHQNLTSCAWKANDGLDTFRYGVHYSMGVSIVNVRNNETAQKLYPEKLKAIKVDTSMIVEPAPIKGLISIPNSTCVMLSWEDEKQTWQKVTYMVSFRPFIDQKLQTKSVDELTNVTLCGLRPNMQYNLMVQCIPKSHNGTMVGFWSQPTEITVLTLEDVPSASPGLSPGSFVQTPCHQPNCKNLLLYWQPLSTDEANGKILYYHIDYRNVRAQSSWEKAVVVKQTQYLLTLAASESYVIHIRAATSMGLSDKYSKVYIPTSAERPPVLSHVVEADVDKETTVTVYWEMPSKFTSDFWLNLTSYTLFWCRGYSIEKYCLQSPINSVEVSITATQYTLSIDKFEAYKFGVAVNAWTKNGEIISSGFQWNKCIYIKNTRPTVMPTNFRLSTYQPNQAISIEWDKSTCEQSSAYVQSYIVSVCLSLIGGACSGKTSSFQVDRSENRLTLYDLYQGSRYKIWVSAMSDGGHGPDSGALFSVVINRNIKAAEMGGVVGGAIFILIISLFGIVFCIRKIFTTVKQKYFDPVSIEILPTLPPLPPIPMLIHQTSVRDSCNGIYEKIVESPSSPVPSAESTTGVESLLNHNKWKIMPLKEHIYGHTKEKICFSTENDQQDKSHSADTLLMRLCLSHLKKQKNMETVHTFGCGIADSQDLVYNCNSNKSSVTCLDNQETSIYHLNSCLDNQEPYHFKNSDIFQRTECADVNPYICVDIVSKIEAINDNLKRHRSEGEVNMDFTSKGSTLSLPPSLCKISQGVSQSLSDKAQSKGDKLEFDHQGISAMKVAHKFELSVIDNYKNIAGQNDNENSDGELESLGSQSNENPTQLNSYIQFYNETNAHSNERNLVKFTECDCCFHRNNYLAVGHESVNQNLKSSSQENCDSKVHDVKMLDAMMERIGLLQDLNITETQPESPVFNLPSYFFRSMNILSFDPARTTEL